MFVGAFDFNRQEFGIPQLIQFKPTARTPLIFQILAIAVLYAGLGKLGLLMAIPPGYATMVWPSSGVALVAVLFFGFRVWPGVLLGSVLTNIWTGLDTTTLATAVNSLGVPCGIGIGASLQAVAGAFMLQKFAGYPNALSSQRQVFTFLIIGGPIACLTSALIGTSVLLAVGAIPASNFLINFGTWWIGDSIGVFIVSPLAMVWFFRNQEDWKGRQWPVTIPILSTFLIVLAATDFGASWERSRLVLQLEKQANAVASSLYKDLAIHIEIVQSLESYYAATDDVSRAEFRTFVEFPISAHKGIRALSFNPLIPDEKRAEFEQSVREEGYADFKITELDAQGRLIPAAKRPFYIAVNYVEPFEENAKALGYDVNSNPVRRAALDAARDSGQPTATQRLNLVQDTGNDFGVLVITPTYKKGLPHETVEQRRQNLTGYMVGVLGGKEILEPVLKSLDQEGLILRLVDETNPEQEQLLYENEPLENSIYVLEEEGLFGSSIRVERSFPIPFGGRQWLLHVSPNQTYLAQHRPENLWILMLSGMLTVSLIGAYTMVLSGQQSLLRKKVNERTAALTSAIDEAENANRAKSNFLSTMSHEIRTPLNGVLGLAQLLKNSPLEPDQREKVNTILTSGATLLAILNDVLDMSKIEAGGLELEEKTFSLDRLVSTISEPFQNLANDKGLELEILNEVENNLLIKGDPVRLRQILWNLLSNAIKFTEKGQVTLTVKSEPEPAIATDTLAKSKDHLLSFSVLDTGTGIATDQFDTLFDPFTQEDSSITRRHGGTGLGLTIVKQLTELMGGTIDVESSPGSGSQFCVTIPFMDAGSDQASDVTNEKSDEVLQPTQTLNVLVAEDNQVNAVIAKAFIEKFGHSVKHVENGKEAVDLASTGWPDLILMDIHMPEMDGMEATEIIRKSRSARQLPIIGVTAEAFTDRHVLFLKAGMNDILTKPFTEKQLADVLAKNRLIDRRAIDRDNGDLSSASATVPTGPDPKQETPSFLSRPVGDDGRLQELRSQLSSDVVANLLAEAQSNLQHRLDELTQAVQAGNTVKVRETAHAIKGASGSLFAIRLSEMAAEIEQKSNDMASVQALMPDFERASRDTLKWWNSHADTA